jgi:hypothetical protein
MNEHLEILIKWIALAEGSFAINEKYLARNKNDFSSIDWK